MGALNAIPPNFFGHLERSANPSNSWVIIFLLVIVWVFLWRQPVMFGPLTPKHLHRQWCRVRIWTNWSTTWANWKTSLAALQTVRRVVFFWGRSRFLVGFVKFEISPFRSFPSQNLEFCWWLPGDRFGMSGSTTRIVAPERSFEIQEMMVSSRCPPGGRWQPQATIRAKWTISAASSWPASVTWRTFLRGLKDVFCVQDVFWCVF